MNYEITNFVEFWQAIKKIPCEEDEALLFIGHPDKNYRLVPGVFRELVQDEEVRQYHNILVEYPEEFWKRSHLSNLVKMQHYGLSTRLLDFSRNPLVSLLFASENISADVDGEVIVTKIKKKRNPSS